MKIKFDCQASVHLFFFGLASLCSDFYYFCARHRAEKFVLIPRTMKDMDKVKKMMQYQSAPVDNVHTATATSDTDYGRQQISQATLNGSSRKELSKPSTTRKCTTSAEKITTKLLESSLAKLVGQSNFQYPDNKESSANDDDHASSNLITDISAAEPNHVHHLRLNLEPIRTQIISYLTLLRKMTTNHP